MVKYYFKYINKNAFISEIITIIKPFNKPLLAPQRRAKREG